MNIEIIKLFRDKNWRIENLYKIVDKQSRLRFLKLNQAQKTFFQKKQKRSAVLKARQFGFTTFGVIDLLDTVIWNENRTACILAHKREVLDKIFNIVRIAYDNLPENLRPKIDRGGGSKYELYFPETNSTIYTTLEVRGGTIHDLHISEAAFIPYERIHATLQAVPVDEGRVTFETTPNGLNHFYDLWQDDKNEISKHFFPWFFHPEYQIETSEIDYTLEELALIANAQANFGIKLSKEQIAFRRYKIREAQGRLEKFLAEYPEDDSSCFLSSGSNPFNLALLKEKISSIPDRPLELKGELKIFQRPDKTKNYVIGCDPAEGVMSDNSVMDVYCIETKEQVAFFSSNQISPSNFAELIYSTGKMYSFGGRWPMAIVERNNHGHAVLLKLDILCYPNIWEDTDDRPGHRTTALSRPLLLDNFIQSVTDGYLSFNSKQTLLECLTLVDNNGKIEADSGKHDDAVIAAALALKAIINSAAKIDLYSNISKKIRV